MEIWSGAGCTGKVLHGGATVDTSGIFERFDYEPIQFPPVYLRIWKYKETPWYRDTEFILEGSGSREIAWEKSYGSSDLFDECLELDVPAYGQMIDAMMAIICFGPNEMIRVKREGDEGILDIPIKEAKYGDKVLAVNEKMEEIWDDILFLDHFTECSVFPFFLCLFGCESTCLGASVTMHVWVWVTLLFCAFSLGDDVDYFFAM